MKIRNLLDVDHARKAYERTIGLISAVILTFTILTMFIGAFRLFYQVGQLLQTDGITGSYLNLFTDVLTLFILIELSRSLFDSLDKGSLFLPGIIDVGIVFTIRHIMIELFNHKLEPPDIAALGFLMIAMGVLRLSLTFNQRTETRESVHHTKG